MTYKPSGSAGNYIEYYSYDASGNALSVYEEKASDKQTISLISTRNNTNGSVSKGTYSPSDVVHFTFPATITVNSGGAGNGIVWFEYRLNGLAKRIYYQGQGNNMYAHTTAATLIQNGIQAGSDYPSLSQMDLESAPGQTILYADYVEFVLYNGDGIGATTQATLALSQGGLKVKDQYLYGSSRLGSFANGNFLSGQIAPVMVINKANVYLEVTDHLGNVRAVVSCTTLTVISGVKYAGIVSLTDYYPFGMVMRRFTASGGEYRYAVSYTHLTLPTNREV